MWFQKKKKKEIEQAVKGLLDRLEEKTDRILTAFDELRQCYGENERQIRRQSDSFEDLLDEIQARQEEQNSKNRQWQEMKRREEALLELICHGREQMWLLKGQLLKEGVCDEGKRQAWAEQFHLMDMETKKMMRPCGVEETGVLGERVDYGIHEVLQVVETGEEKKENTVAEVYSPGIMYSGRLLRKAKVAVYKRSQ